MLRHESFDAKRLVIVLCPKLMGHNVIHAKKLGKRVLCILRLTMGADKPKADLLPGTLDMLVLKILLRGHLHGYAIAQLIQQLSDDLLRVEEGSLYPALQRLELNGWIEGEWGLSANNRRARFYKLTRDGRKHLSDESARYRQVTGAVARIMGFA